MRWLKPIQMMNVHQVSHADNMCVMFGMEEDQKLHQNISMISSGTTWIKLILIYGCQYLAKLSYRHTASCLVGAATILREMVKFIFHELTDGMQVHCVLMLNGALGQGRTTVLKVLAPRTETIRSTALISSMRKSSWRTKDNDNIFRANMYIALTSKPMVALFRVLSMMHDASCNLYSCSLVGIEHSQPWLACMVGAINGSCVGSYWGWCIRKKI